jgi:hypothetical protein
MRRRLSKGLGQWEKRNEDKTHFPLLEYIVNGKEKLRLALLSVQLFDLA